MKQLEFTLKHLMSLRHSEKLPEQSIERMLIESCIKDLEAVTEHISNLEGQLDEADKYLAEMQEQLDNSEGRNSVLKSLLIN